MAQEHFLSPGVTLLYGHGNSGKTSVCLDLALNAVQQGKKVLYVDTEGGVSRYRLQDMLKARGIPLNIVDNKNEMRVKTLSVRKLPTLEQMMASLQIVQKVKPEMVVYDSVVAHYMTLICSQANYGTASKKLIVFIGQLNVIAVENNICALLTTQPVSDVKIADIKELERGIGRSDYEQRRFVGSKALEFDPKIIVKLEKTSQNTAQAKLEKSRDKPTGEVCSFNINSRGVS